MTNSDTYTTVSHQSWGSRLGSSIKGILGGLVLLVAGIYLLIWNESNAVAAHKSLQQAERDCFDLNDVTAVDPSYEGKLVHVTGKVSVDLGDSSSSGVVVQDDEFHVVPPYPVIKLKRSVEMYQWVESTHTKTTKNTGGSTDTETTYSYHKEWANHVVNSQSFHAPEQHENPDRMPFAEQIWVAPLVHLGALDIPPVVLDRMDWYQPLLSANYSAGVAALELAETCSHISVYSNQGYYLGQDPNYPAVGDTRITFEFVPEQVASIVAQQSGTSLAAYQSKNKRSVLLVERGSVPAEEMFAQAQSQVTLWAWFCRGAGFLLLWTGLQALVKPVGVLFDVIPFMGNLVEAGSSVVCGTLAFSLASVVIAISWLAVRPGLSGGLLVVAGALAYWIWQRARSSNAPPSDQTEVKRSSNAHYPTEAKPLIS